MYGNLNRMGNKSCIAKIGMNSMRNVTVCEEVEVLGGGELFETPYLSAEEVEVLGGGRGIGHQHVDIVSVYFHFTAVTHLQQKHTKSPHWLYKLSYNVCLVGLAKLKLLLKTWT